jgi:hypothetical protein
MAAATLGTSLSEIGFITGYQKNKTFELRNSGVIKRERKGEEVVLTM